MWSGGETRAVIALALLLGLHSALVPVPTAAQRGERVAHRNLAELVEEAATIFRGQVTHIEIEPHPVFENLPTIVVTLEVLEVLKGQVNGNTHYSFRQFVPDLRDRDSRLGYKVGQEVLLLMIEPSQYGLSSPAGLEQGRFRVLHDAQGNASVVNGFNNLGLFRNIGKSAPRLGQQLSATAQQMLTEHRGGPIRYDQLREMIHGIVALEHSVGPVN